MGLPINISLIADIAERMDKKDFDWRENSANLPYRQGGRYPVTRMAFELSIHDSGFRQSLSE